MADAKTEKQKVKEITDKLEEGLKALFESEKYKSYLSTMSKFHNYSFNNTRLIAVQKPEATLVAGYQAWQKNFNRHVNKGEKGIRILAPAPYKIKEERDKLDPVTGEVILDKEGMSESQTLKTMVHETAHSMLHDREVNKDILAPVKDRNTKEVEDYLEGERENGAYLSNSPESMQTRPKEKAPVTLSQEPAGPEVTLTVAECGEFHNLGEFYENIPTVEEAAAIWKQIPPERMNGIPAIGVNIHTPGMEAFEDVGIDILSRNRIDLDILEYIPDIKGNPQAMEVVAELVAKLPEMEIDGNMSEGFEAKVWEKRMPDLTPAEQLAVEIDRFIYDYDTALYRDNSQSMTENVSEIAEALKQRDTHDMALWIAEIAADGMEPEERKRALELLKKLAEYKPLAKIEEMEEQNYNMVDNVLNNGAGEKAQKEENKKRAGASCGKDFLKSPSCREKGACFRSGKRP